MIQPLNITKEDIPNASSNDLNEKARIESTNKREISSLQSELQDVRNDKKIEEVTMNLLKL